MYIILIENFISKEYLEPEDVHDNVRKWPNLCSIRPQECFEVSWKSLGRLTSFGASRGEKGTLIFNTNHDSLDLCVDNT